MNTHDSLKIASDLFYQAYELHLRGEFEDAVKLYRQSIEAFPTAEAHTFLGWTYSFQGKLDDAIAECKKAIRINPDFGNPYNDIGAYLIQKSHYEEAIPWLLNAARSKDYDNLHYAHYNLAHAYLGLEQFNKAREEFENALRISPEYEMARAAIGFLKQKIQ